MSTKESSGTSGGQGHELLSVESRRMRSDNAAFYAFGKDSDLPPPMSTTFADF